MLTPIEKILFAVAVVASLYFGFIGFRKVYQVIRRGQGDYDDQHIVQRAWKALVEWVALLPTWRVRLTSSIFHAFVAWCFMFFFLVNVGDLLEGYFPIEFLGNGLIGGVYRFVADILAVAALVGVVYFILRRFVFNAPALQYRDNVKLMPSVQAGRIRRDSLIVALFILAHVGFRFLGESFNIALQQATEGTGDAWQPFASLVSHLWTGMGANALLVAEHISWWLALGLILAFIPYFPYTKHIHLIMSGANFLTKPQRISMGTIEPINFEDESIEQFGAARLEQLPWTNLLDSYACIMCNRCQDQCPAYTTGKELSPSALEVNKRIFINENLDALSNGAESSATLIDFALSESAVWACTTCGACIQVCPVGNEPMFDILHIRRNQVLMESEFPEQLQSAFKGMERSGNPWNLSARDRMRWAEGLDVPTIDDNPEPEILWWVGCAPAYDPRAQDTAKAFARVLNAAGVNYAVLGEAETCTGDSARRSGNEYLFFEMAKANIETLNEVNPPRIVTTCPHCLQALARDYRQYGGNYNVIHHTQLINELVAAGKLKLAGMTEGAYTFHDPCYLGRQNGIFDAPRDALHGVGINLIEMPRHGALSFCCGAGGGQMWKEEEHGSEAVNMNRYKEAAATGARTIAVGCPFCLTMLTDASKQADQGIKVLDVGEIIASHLPGNGTGSSAA